MRVLWSVCLLGFLLPVSSLHSTQGRSVPAFVPTRLHSGQSQSFGSYRSPLAGRQPLSTLRIDAHGQQGGDGPATTRRLERPMGSWERLLGRRKGGPGDSKLALAHGALYTGSLSSDLSSEEIESALDRATRRLLRRHPLLRCAVEWRPLDLSVGLRGSWPHFVESVSVSPGGERKGMETETAREDRETAWVRTAVRVEECPEGVDAQARALECLQREIDAAEMPLDGPQWRFFFFHSPTGNRKGERKFSVVLLFNHALSDQTSANLIARDLFSFLTSEQKERETGASSDASNVNMMMEGLFSFLKQPQKKLTKETKEETREAREHDASLPMPPPIENVVLPTVAQEKEERSLSLPSLLSVLQNNLAWPQSPGHILHAASASFDPQVMLSLPETENGKKDESSRKTILLPVCLGGKSFEVKRLRDSCREKGTTVTGAICAAGLRAWEETLREERRPMQGKTKLLVSTNLRQFAPGGGKGPEEVLPETLWSAASAVTFVLGESEWTGGLEQAGEEGGLGEAFWELARKCKQETGRVIAEDGIRQAALLFDFGMRVADIETVVEAASGGPVAGRSNTLGISNAGVWPGPSEFVCGDGDRKCGGGVQALQLESVLYGVSNAGNGALVQVSCQTVGSRLCMCLQATESLVPQRTLQRFANALERNIKAAMGTGVQEGEDSEQLTRKSGVPVGSNESAEIVKTIVHDALQEAGVLDVAEVFRPALDHVVELILPGTTCPTPASECADCVGGGENGACDVLDDLTSRSLRTRALRVLSESFGGGRCSGSSDIGAWVDSKGTLVIEDATVCTATTSLVSLRASLPTVIDFVRQVGRELGQDMMALSVDGGLLLVPPNPAVEGKGMEGGSGLMNLSVSLPRAGATEGGACESVDSRTEFK
uniref:Condensation domain-containing protein n=1 Tax=Chromera velia CCMP2878 TaxID=1169474 RepID=A0A0G4GQM0_9ALVE|eukprot:Cvel_22942.t1-p1 / transcript=Cvel_22942.t1 / gene=Cvel_22942 / organism=Chromera_velia_CCMP2878 / gene_product=hypothetical protein / transcript_product=hypothetical protein / location=Cvel_scaffold2309:18677-24231(+) / protein_length=891 / sequence_SO=supercontig / SO=protein_coding / is_pseudo=false